MLDSPDPYQRSLLQAPCRAELQRALDRLASNTRTHDDLFTIPIPNCDKNGDFHAKQVCDSQRTLNTQLYGHVDRGGSVNLRYPANSNKNASLLLQTAAFELHQQSAGQNTTHDCSRWNIASLVQDQHRSVSKQTAELVPRPCFSKLTWKVIYFHKSSRTMCVKRFPLNCWTIITLLLSWLQLAFRCSYFFFCYSVFARLGNYADKRERIREHKNTDKSALSCICNQSSRRRVSDKRKRSVKALVI